MLQSVKFLLCKCEDLSSVPRHPCQRPGIMARTCNLKAKEIETGWCRPASVAELNKSGFSERCSLEKIKTQKINKQTRQWAIEEDTRYRCLAFIFGELSMYIYTHTHIELRYSQICTCYTVKQTATQRDYKGLAHGIRGSWEAQRSAIGLLEA